MGVLGLTPFLRKAYPQVIKSLPDRLQSLSGKTLVIDATLITHRLHFAGNPHDYRHILGWYRLVEELRECGVKAICVFDGHRRLTAKAFETARRSSLRKISATRATHESERAARLSSLTRVLNEIQHLDPNARTILLARLQSELKPPQLKQSITQPLIVTDMDADDDLDVEDDLNLEDDVNVKDDVGVKDSVHVKDYVDAKDDILDDSSGLWNKIQELFRAIRPSQGSNHNSLYRTFLRSLLRLLPDTPVASSPRDAVSPDSIFSQLMMLCKQVQQSDTKLPPSPSFSVLSDIEDTHDTSSTDDVTMTPAQGELNLAEETLWSAISMSSESDITILQANASSLAEKSRTMSESLRRRTRPPTSQVYRESKELIQALGIPCITVEEDYEAEAVASSLVLEGFADYVASEDTDVLIYDAPMIRNISSRKGPLLLMSGSEVRSELSLDRARFIDFALLLGTDFSQRIKNVGPTKALRFIREYGSIERVVELETKYAPRPSAEQYLEQVEVARSIFQNLPPVPRSELLEQKDSDNDKVATILQRCGLGAEAMKKFDYHCSLEGNYFDDDPTYVSNTDTQIEDGKPL